MAKKTTVYILLPRTKSSLAQVYYLYEIGENLYLYSSSDPITVKGNSAPIKLEKEESLTSWIAKHKFYKLIKTVSLYTGCYYPRVAWRGTSYNIVDQIKCTQSYEATNMLISQLNKILLTIYPSPENNSAFGHEIRALLLLACMEVESNFTAILKENGYTKDRYSTRDFVKLKDHLSLDEYEITLKLYPEYPTIKPFCGWNNRSPTQSLSWYNAYNETKHNREEHFKSGNLENAINAIAGLSALLDAQFCSTGNLHKIEGVVIKRPLEKYEQAYLPHPNARQPQTYKQINLEL
ncbi:MAG: hypothetical protein KAS94_00820 [Desulfobulbaceae bacterium]|nr:hypothetical protein [Desulfobulbaceae bacterium]